MESMQATRAFCWTLHSTSHADGSSSEEETSTGVEEGGKEDMIVYQWIGTERIPDVSSS